MELLTPYLVQLGLAGVVFIVLLTLAQLGLTQFFKVLVQTLFKKSAFNFTGVWILGLSVVLGGLLGTLMLSRVATLLDIQLPSPWGGVLAGMILAAIVSGLVSYRQQRLAEKAAGVVTPDLLAGLLAQVTQASAGPLVVAPPVAVPAASAVPASPGAEEVLTPITPEQASRLTSTALPDVALGQPEPGWLQQYQSDAPLVTGPEGSL